MRMVGFAAHTGKIQYIIVIYSIPRYFARSLTVVLPYFPTGTMERIDQEGQISTAHTLAVILSAIPLTANGPARIVMYDIHALQERFYFGNNVIPILMSAIPLLRNRLREAHSGDKLSIAFPDEGAMKRFGGHFADYPLILCAKVRGEGSKRVVTVKEGDPKGHHVLIVDDLVKTGGTLIECKNALLAAGAQCVSAYVTHAVFPEESWRRFAKEAGTPTGFKHFYVTDSCPTTADALHDQKPFHVLSLAQSLLDAIQTYCL